MMIKRQRARIAALSTDNAFVRLTVGRRAMAVLHVLMVLGPFMLCGDAARELPETHRLAHAIVCMASSWQGAHAYYNLGSCQLSVYKRGPFGNGCTACANATGGCRCYVLVLREAAKDASHGARHKTRLLQSRTAPAFSSQTQRCLLFPSASDGCRCRHCLMLLVKTWWRCWRRA